MFAGRKEEIEQLLSSFNHNKGTLNVIRGRRRIGKTRLIKELPSFGKNVTLRYLTSTPPNPKVSDEEERTHYAEQVKSQFDLPYMPPYSSWRELFAFIGDLCSEKKTILAIDEVNWLATRSPGFMSMFFELWENRFTQKQQFMIILSGSLSSWIEENILMNKGFVGRISVSITLKELKLADMPAFFGPKIKRTPTVDIIKMLSACGAVPRYLEEFDLSRTAEVNLEKLAFSESGLLHDEFEKMFYDLFSKENQFYRNILETMGNSSELLSPQELARKMKLSYSGRYTSAINTLTEVGFIRKQHTWDFAKNRDGKKYVLRLSDNYTAFYFRAITKAKSLSLLSSVTPKNLSSLLGLQFENLSHNNIEFILNKLNIKKQDVSFTGPYFQTRSAVREACQIDLLIHTRSRVYICECKLLSTEVTSSVIAEVEAKAKKLKVPKGISIHPVLIHGNQVSDSVIEKDYFDEVIDLGDGLLS